jgi:predicted dehydrogenase
MRPRLGFLGVGWIGRNRLQALLRSGMAEVVAVADPVERQAREAADLASCPALHSLDDLLALELDGLVIATPSALHADQATAALEHGLAVFCQKPLGRTATETAAVVAVARATDRHLGVDLSYRYLDGARRMKQLIRSGTIGEVFAADLVFHNAYGPDKPWFYDPALSGGGCVMDLGIHLVDLALWMLEPHSVSRVSSHLFAEGQPLTNRAEQVEDYGAADLELGNGALLRLACSWKLSAGCDAEIQASFYGTEGALRLSNVGGSFYDFQTEQLNGVTRVRLGGPPEDWGGRALIDWTNRLAAGATFDSEADRLVEVAVVLDEIYDAAMPAGIR